MEKEGKRTVHWDKGAAAAEMTRCREQIWGLNGGARGCRAGGRERPGLLCVLKHRKGITSRKMASVVLHLNH
jgi:hypothetical protein